VLCNDVWTDYSQIQTVTTPPSSGKNTPLFDVFDKTENILTSNVYPNPAKNEVNVTFMSSAQNEVQINVLDITGRTLITQKAQSDIWETEVILDISKLQTGYYFVEVNDGITSTTSKLNVIK
jgi:calcineurin-like phosphoesterase